MLWTGHFLVRSVGKVVIMLWQRSWQTLQIHPHPASQGMCCLHVVATFHYKRHKHTFMSPLSCNCSVSLTLIEVIDLVNLCPCAKYEDCRSNGSWDITCQRLTYNLPLGQGHSKLLDLQSLLKCPSVPNMKVVGQMVPKILHLLKIDLDPIVQGHSKLFNLKSLLTCPPVPNMKVVGQMVPDITAAKDWLWTIGSRSFKIRGPVGLVNLSPCAKCESCTSNGSQDIAC